MASLTSTSSGGADTERDAARVVALDTSVLFVVQRSQNRNTVAYSWVQDSVNAQWFMFQTDPTGNTRELLTPSEKKLVFGIKQKGVQFYIKSMPDLHVHVGFQNERPVAIATVGGIKLIVKRVWLDLKTVLGFTLPLTEFIDVHGIDAETGAAARVRINVSEAAKKLTKT